MTTTLTPGDTETSMTMTDTARARPHTETVDTMTTPSTIMTRQTTTDLCHMTDPGVPDLFTGTRKDENVNDQVSKMMNI